MGSSWSSKSQTDFLRPNCSSHFCFLLSSLNPVRRSARLHIFTQTHPTKSWLSRESRESRESRIQKGPGLTHRIPSFHPSFLSSLFWKKLLFVPDCFKFSAQFCFQCSGSNRSLAGKGVGDEEVMLESEVICSHFFAYGAEEISLEEGM